ncbi:hypothetical protein GCM10027188_04540 [Lysobacter humi (ex Lee et al. 2017)]
MMWNEITNPNWIRDSNSASIEGSPYDPWSSIRLRIVRLRTRARHHGARPVTAGFSARCDAVPADDPTHRIPARRMRSPSPRQRPHPDACIVRTHRPFARTRRY